MLTQALTGKQLKGLVSGLTMLPGISCGFAIERAGAGCSFQERGEHEWESFVSMHRPSFTSDFFSHLENLVMAAHTDRAHQEGKVFASHCWLRVRPFTILSVVRCVLCVSPLPYYMICSCQLKDSS